MSTESKPSVLFLGATGYIGGVVLEKLLPHNHPITVLVRSEDKGKLLEALRPEIKAVKGSFSDYGLLEDLASKHDIVYNTVDADDLPATEAILKGMATRKAATGHRPILIHTSGTGLLADQSKGLYPTDTIYSDLQANPDAKPPLIYVDSIPDSALHRNVDLAILAADEKADIKSYIILPSTIYGISTGELSEKKIANPQSQQMPAMIRASIGRKEPGMVGQGLNIWPNVHIDDIASLFEVVHKLALSGQKGNHGRQGYFFGESGEHTLYAAAETAGQELVKAGVVKSATPTPFTKDDLDKYFGGSDYLGSNSRARADRSRKVGWKPKYDARDFFEQLKSQVQYTLKELEASGGEIKPYGVGK